MTHAAAMAVALCFSALAPAVAADQPPAAQSPDDNIRKAKEFFVAQGNTTPSASPASEEEAAKPAKEFTEEDVDKRVQEVIAERTKDGAFVFHDPKLDADLNLVFEQIKIVRGMEGYGWFANTIFHDKDEPKKQYAIDFWLKPEGDKLTLMDIRVQKGPKQEGDGWIMVTRQPVAWWWLPVQEHPGDMEVTRAWQVMSAIHTYIATHKDADGHLDIKDDKTGETASPRFRRDPPAGASPQERGRVLRVHRLPQAGQQGRVLRH